MVRPFWLPWPMGRDQIELVWDLPCSVQASGVELPEAAVPPCSDHPSAAPVSRLLWCVRMLRQYAMVSYRTVSPRRLLFASEKAYSSFDRGPERLDSSGRQQPPRSPASKGPRGQLCRGRGEPLNALLGLSGLLNRNLTYGRSLGMEGHHPFPIVTPVLALSAALSRHQGPLRGRPSDKRQDSGNMAQGFPTRGESSTTPWTKPRIFCAIFHGPIVGLSVDPARLFHSGGNVVSIQGFGVLHLSTTLSSINRDEACWPRLQERVVSCFGLALRGV